MNGGISRETLRHIISEVAETTEQARWAFEHGRIWYSGAAESDNVWLASLLLIDEAALDVVVRKVGVFCDWTSEDTRAVRATRRVELDAQFLGEREVVAERESEAPDA